MIMRNIFQEAAVRKVRFNSTKGPVAVEQLYDLPLTSAKGTSLNSIAAECDQERQSTKVTSYVNRALPSPDAQLWQLKFDLVMAVITDREAMNRAVLDAKNNREAKAAELELLQNAQAQRKQSDLSELTAEELEKRIAELRAA